MRFSNSLNKALMGKQIMHSARALFLTFLALEKSKRNKYVLCKLFRSGAEGRLAKDLQRKNCAGAVQLQRS